MQRADLIIQLAVGYAQVLVLFEHSRGVPRTAEHREGRVGPSAGDVGIDREAARRGGRSGFDLPVRGDVGAVLRDARVDRIQVFLNRVVLTDKGFRLRAFRGDLLLEPGNVGLVAADARDSRTRRHGDTCAEEAQRAQGHDGNTKVTASEPSEPGPRARHGARN